MEWNLFGHEWAAQILQKHIQNNSLRHAYLFSGPPGIGRRSLAIRFAQAINCVQPAAPGVPCGECRICKHTAAMQQADLSILQSTEDSTTIKVEQVRELQRNLSLTPYESHYRIALLLNFQQATASAQNALLKTLEEPPSQVILLLTCDSIENLLPTITSRCEILRLRPLPLPVLSTKLTELWQLDSQQAQELAHLSAGRFGLAYDFHENPEKLEQIHQWLLDAFDLLGSNRVERFNYAENYADPRRKGVTKESIAQMLQTWLILWRDILLKVSQSTAPLTYLQFSPWINQTADKLDLDDVIPVISRLEEALQQLDSNLNARLLVENILLDWPHIKIAR